MSLPAAFAGHFCCCLLPSLQLYPPIRLGNRDLISELGLLRWSNLVSDSSSIPIHPSRFSPLRRGSRILEATMFMTDCRVRTWRQRKGQGKEL